MNAPLEVIAANLRAIRADVVECVDKLDAPRFAVSCSQCGREFTRDIPHGFSWCRNHMTGNAAIWYDTEMELADSAESVEDEANRVKASPAWTTLSAPARIAAEWAMAGLESEMQPIEALMTPVIEEAREFWRRVADHTYPYDAAHCLAQNAHSELSGVIAKREEEASLYAIEQEWQRREFIRRYG